MPYQNKLQLPQSHAPISCQLIASNRLSDILHGNDVLAAIVFSNTTCLCSDDPRLVHVGVGIPGAVTPVEMWRGTGNVRTGRNGRINYSENGEAILGHVLVDEIPSMKLDSLIEQAYDEIRAFLSDTGYLHPIRLWNYIPAINLIQEGLERYRAFCVGRYAAVARQPDFLRALPAASAIGTDSPGLLISFLASNVEPTPIENPRQVSAYKYPAVYSPRSPLFSRAVCINRHGWRQLFLSGTASIVGHKSRHVHDVVAQARETSANIKALLDKVRERAGGTYEVAVEPALLRVYLREAWHKESVQRVLAECLGANETTVYLRGEICRSNLLLEVEGVFDISGVED